MKIGIHGRKRVGKDTLQDYLKAKGVVTNCTPFAKYLKETVEKLVPGMNAHTGDRENEGTYLLAPDYEKIILDRFNMYDPFKVLNKAIRIFKPYCTKQADGRISILLSPRRALELFGTEFGRAIDPNIWVDRIPLDNECISDVRFLSEVEWARSQGYMLIKIDKELDYVVTHDSDIGLPNELFDLVIPYEFTEDLESYNNKNLHLTLDAWNSYNAK